MDKINKEYNDLKVFNEKINRENKDYIDKLNELKDKELIMRKIMRKAI